MCDQLVNTCKADATARNTCANAITAASNATPVKTGIQADAFNAVFGITTNFADDPVFDNQGRIVSGDANNGNGNGNNSTGGGNDGNHGGNTGGNTGNNGSCIPVDSGNNKNNGTNGGNNGTIGNFGSCTVPEIEFGAGFDNRRETSFQPVDLGKSDPLSAYLLDPSQAIYANIIWLGMQ